MAGGTFEKSVGAVRPGSYVNFIGTKTETVAGASRGTVLLPLPDTDYGPAGKFITLTAASPDSARAKLGHSVYDADNASMLLIREAFKGANTVIVYICTEGKTAAAGTGGGVAATAKYKGSRGNALSYTIVANPAGGYDVEVDLDGSKMEVFEGITDISGLSSSEYINFTANGESGFVAVAGVTLTGGTDGVLANGDVTTFLDGSEGVSWNTMCFPFDDTTLQAALKTKIKYLRENVGKGVQAVAPNFAADYEGIINVTNSYALGDQALTTAQATAFIAGATAGASKTTSNTYLQVEGATEVVGIKNNEESIAAIRTGELFFSVSEAGNVVIEYDINSLVTIGSTRDSSYKKNRVIRVYDEFRNALALNFPPNKFDNDEDGWEVMEGIGRTILKQFGPRSEGGDGAIQNIDYDNDFLVDRENSYGDQTFFNVGIQAVDSAEKLYFTVSTR